MGCSVVCQKINPLSPPSDGGGGRGRKGTWRQGCFGLDAGNVALCWWKTQLADDSWRHSFAAINLVQTQFINRLCMLKFTV